MKSILAAALALMVTSASADVLFLLSTEPNGQGTQKSFVTARWKCNELAPAGIDKQASWAFVAGGLANGCTLYDDAGCKGKSLVVEKNNSNILGPGPVNLTDYNFDKMASSFDCF